MSLDIQRKSEIREAVAKTIAFFDIFDYPLTEFELWRYAGIKCRLSEVREALQDRNILSAGFSREQNGFYYLSGRERIIASRNARYNFANGKFKRARLMVRLFAFVPWIKMVAVSNLIGANNLKKKSDIDLLIITEAKRVWITRLFCVVIVMALNLRPRPERTENTICMNFYLSLEDLNIEKFRLDRDDIYYNYWLAGLMPVYEREDTYRKFIAANGWIREKLPNWQSNTPVWKAETAAQLPDLYNETVDLLFGGLDQRVKKIQLMILPERLRKNMNRDTRIVINDRVLKLYANDRREEYRQLYNSRLKVQGYG